MGAAIAERIKHKYRVSVFDKDSSKISGLKGIDVAPNSAELVKKSDVVILAVKPQDFGDILNEIKSSINDKLVVSIAAGKMTAAIEAVLGNVRVIRVMPNLPARVGKGVSCLCKGKFAVDEDLALVSGIFNLLGITFILPEQAMHFATAFSGSGPGFWCQAVENIPRNKWDEYNKTEFIPAYSRIGEDKGGLNGEDAWRIAEMVALGSTLTVDSWKIGPQELKLQVASKGGTTEAGLDKLRKGGTLADAVEAALRRSEELSGV